MESCNTGAVLLRQFATALWDSGLSWVSNRVNLWSSFELRVQGGFPSPSEVIFRDYSKRKHVRRIDGVKFATDAMRALGLQDDRTILAFEVGGGLTKSGRGSMDPVRNFDPMVIRVTRRINPGQAEALVELLKANWDNMSTRIEPFQEPAAKTETGGAQQAE